VGNCSSGWPGVRGWPLKTPLEGPRISWVPGAAFHRPFQNFQGAGPSRLGKEGRDSSSAGNSRERRHRVGVRLIERRASAAGSTEYDASDRSTGARRGAAGRSTGPSRPLRRLARFVGVIGR